MARTKSKKPRHYTMDTLRELTGRQRQGLYMTAVRRLAKGDRQEARGIRLAAKDPVRGLHASLKYAAGRAAITQGASA